MLLGVGEVVSRVGDRLFKVGALVVVVRLFERCDCGGDVFFGMDDRMALGGLHYELSRG